MDIIRSPSFTYCMKSISRYIVIYIVTDPKVYIYFNHTITCAIFYDFWILHFKRYSQYPLQMPTIFPYIIHVKCGSTSYIGCIFPTSFRIYSNYYIIRITNMFQHHTQNRNCVPSYLLEIKFSWRNCLTSHENIINKQFPN